MYQWCLSQLAGRVERQKDPALWKLLYLVLGAMQCFQFAMLIVAFFTVLGFVSSEALEFSHGLETGFEAKCSKLFEEATKESLANQSDYLFAGDEGHSILRVCTDMTKEAFMEELGGGFEASDILLTEADCNITEPENLRILNSTCQTNNGRNCSDVVNLAPAPGGYMWEYTVTRINETDPKGCDNVLFTSIAPDDFRPCEGKTVLNIEQRQPGVATYFALTTIFNFVVLMWYTVLYTWDDIAYDDAVKLETPGILLYALPDSKFFKRLPDQLPSLNAPTFLMLFMTDLLEALMLPILHASGCNMWDYPYLATAWIFTVLGIIIKFVSFLRGVCQGTISRQESHTGRFICGAKKKMTCSTVRV